MRLMASYPYDVQGHHGHPSGLPFLFLSWLLLLSHQPLMLQALSSLGEFITSQVVFLSITTVISLNPFSDDFHFVLSKNQICWSSIRFPVPWGPTYSFLNSALLYIHYVQEPVPGSARYSPKIQPFPCTQISPNTYPLLPSTSDQ